MQKWLDALLMYKTYQIITNNKNHPNFPEIDSKSVYDYKWSELENPNNKLVSDCYKYLVELVPLLDGETIQQRLKLLRYLYRSPGQNLYDDNISSITSYR